MPLINRFSTIDKGALIFTGNTLGLAGYLSTIPPLPVTNPPLLPGPGAVDSIGTFITTQNLTEPGGWPPGTTNDYLQNSSSAQLTIPAGSTILYAELIWSGTIINQNFDLSANIADPIDFTTPAGLSSISPDPVTLNLFSQGVAGNTDYIASQNVTALVQAGLSGTYTVGKVPGVLGNSVNSFDFVTPQNYLGWTLEVAYSNPTLPVRNLYIWVNDDLINAGSPPLDIPVIGLATATTGPLSGKLFITAGEGDASGVGDQAFFGPNVGSLVNIGNTVLTPNPNPGTAPNNPGNNFFCSQINGVNGLLDTTGTFGIVNQDAFQGTNVSAARQGWDIATVDISNTLLNNQTSAVIRLSTVGDAYVNTGLGLQVNALEPIFEMNKTADKTIVNVGDTVTYTVTMKNISIINADNVLFTDVIPPATSFVAGSVLIDGVPQGGADPVAGINLGTIVPNQTVTVVFTVKVNSLPLTPPIPPQISNVGTINYTFTPVVGQTLTGTNNTPPVITEVVQPNLVINKAVDKSFADLGDIITYTVTLENAGVLALNNVKFQDFIPAGTTYIGSSLNVDAAFTGTDPQSGLTITTINPGQTVTITWQVKIGNIFPVPNPIPNVGIVTILGLQPVNTNQVTTQVNNADLVSPGNFIKSVDKAFADIGDILIYTVTAKNTGNVAANNVIITDIVPNGTSYLSGTLTVDGLGNPSDPNAGVNVGTVNPGQTVTLVFSVKVDVIPNPNPMPNKADVIYNYTVDPAQLPKTASGTTNTVTTQVNNADLVSPGNFVKSVDKAFADIGDTVTYTITAKNTGNVAANNVIVKDIVPNGADYVAGSLKVDGIGNPSDPNTGISIGTIAAGNNVVIVFSVVVTAIPNPNPMPNKADVTYNYIVDPGKPAKSVSGSTNTVTTQVNHGEIKPDNAVKSANRAVTTPGDVITYTVSFKNTGNTSINNVIVKDVVPVGTIFVPGTVKIDGVLDPLADPTVGINVGTVASGETIVVSFDTKVQDGAPSVLTNTATIDYSYIVDPKLPAKVKSVQTNPVEVDNLNPNLTIVKSSNVVGALVGDTIRYTLNITNNGEIDLANVIVKDPLTAELQFADNMTLNGVAIGGSIVSGVNIGTLIVGKTAVLSFDAKVISLPDDGKIQNISTAKYDYTVSGQTFSKDATSNENVVIVYNPKLDVTKVSNKASVKVGDIFTYTIVAKNSGDIEIKDAIVKDVLPSAFNVQSVKVDGVNVPGDLNIGINIGDLQAGDSKIITVTIKVVSDLVDTFKNVAVVDGLILVDPNQSPRPVEGEGKDNIGVTVFNPELTLVKSVDKEYAVVGEEVTYSIIAANTGDIALDNVIVSDSLAGELEFVIGSIIVDGIAKPLESITSGVNVGTIEPGKNKVITFKAKVLSDVLKEIPNISNAGYEFTLPGVPTQSGSSNSNEVIIKVEKANIVVKKTADKDLVSLGDEITYTVELTNDGTVDALNVIFTDKLPEGTQLINGSFNVNGKVINSVDLQKGVNIGTIKVGSTVTVQYKVTVVSANCSGLLVNEASVKFNYVLPDGTIGTTQSTPDSASSTTVKVNISTFKQISVDEYLAIPKQKPDMECINNIVANVEIVSTHLISTPVDKSNEAQTLTGYKLIISGFLDQSVEYTALVPEQTVHSAHYKVPFSTFIILPEDFTPCSKIEVKGIVEDVYFKEQDCRSFFKNVTVLLVAKIIKCSE